LNRDKIKFRGECKNVLIMKKFHKIMEYGGSPVWDHSNFS